MPPKLNLLSNKQSATPSVPTVALKSIVVTPKDNTLEKIDLKQIFPYAKHILPGLNSYLVLVDSIPDESTNFTDVDVDSTCGFGEAITKILKHVPFSDALAGYVKSMTEFSCLETEFKKLGKIEEKVYNVMVSLQQYLKRMDKFLFLEVNRLAKTKLLGVATQQDVTRLDYLFNFLTAVSYCKPQGSSEDGFLGKKKMKTISTWFFLFNCGHLKDERAAERFLLYKLWKSINEDQKKANGSNNNEDSSLDSSPTEVGNDSPITETQKRNFDNRQPSSSSSKKLKDYLEKNNDCDLFLKNFPKELKSYAKDIILSSDWNYFHRVLSVWRINEDKSILTDKCKQYLVSMAKKFMIDDDDDDDNISNTKKEFYILRQIVYLITDPPQKSLFNITLESFKATVERGLFHKLYDGADERSKVLQIENQYYINAKLMSPEYAESIRMNVIQDLFYNDPFNAPPLSSNSIPILEPANNLENGIERKNLNTNSTESQSTSLEYCCTIIHPGHRDGDFEKYNQVKEKLQNESAKIDFNNIYVSQWVGDTNTFTNFYLFFEPTVEQLYTMLKISCSEWEKKYGSCYRGIKEMYNQFYIPLTTSFESLTSYLLSELVHKKTKSSEKRPFTFKSKQSKFAFDSVWTLCYGNDEGINSVKKYLKLAPKNKKDVDFEALALYKSFSSTLERELNENDKKIFIILWGGIEIVDTNEKKQEFDMCWFSISKNRWELYLGEAKSGSKNSTVELEKKFKNLDIDATTEFKSRPISYSKFSKLQ